MIITHTRRRTLAALLMAGISGLGAGGALAQESVLHMRLNADIRSIDPGFNRDANTDGVMMHIVEGLVGYKEDATIGNLLAESLDISDDGTVYTFTLRDGVTFHNGEPLTADDVLFSWKRYTAPDSGWRCLPDVSGGLSKVLSVEAPDQKTVVFTLEKPAALFLATLARTDCGGTGIYDEASVDASGGWVAPIGTGPFKLGEWKQGQYIELLRNETYASLGGSRDGYVGDKTPMVDVVRFEVIPDDSAAKAALLSGGVDVIPDIANSDIAELSANPDITVNAAQGMGLNTILFQTRDPLFGDVRMRRALELSLDFPQIVDVVTEGLAQPGRSVVPLPSPYFRNMQAEVPARDIEQAKALLAEAGYDGSAIKWQTSKQYPALFDVAVLGQAMAAEAGLNVEIEVLDWATLEDNYTNGNYQVASFTYSARLDPSMSFDMMSGNKDEQPRKVWDNPKALELIAQSKVQSDPAKRQAIFDELETMMRADLPMLPLYSGFKVAASGKDVSGYNGWTIGLPRAWGVSVGE